MTPGVGREDPVVGPLERGDPEPRQPALGKPEHVALAAELEVGPARCPPHGATFEDGYRAAEICDAMLRSAQTGAREAIEYR